MASSEEMKRRIRDLYAARVAGRLDATLADFSDDVTFDFNGVGAGFPGLAGAVKGKANVAATIEGLIETFRFEDWRERSLIVEGDHAALHWSGRVVFTPTGASDTFDVVDLFTFKDGKIVELRQSTDTAKVKALVSR
jgi:ketosteroid isomerase-like protein